MSVGKQDEGLSVCFMICHTAFYQYQNKQQNFYVNNEEII